ncbi:glycosyltransferase family 32 protein [Citrobacter sedlakii]|uniref:glycosyltransferase family 32 protein n=1 Tax=Citrobacter sedlakii TaxID=67826 RepID=UPI001BAC6314|nr:glycosyltransferase [Citrobacter sedlakii]EKJ8217900.1 polysaccharide biosynthesis protein [Citrobacter sedlakii]QUC31769.1 polysaccharide biosynthesis protein [Citrobacter sedlakii]
MIPKIIHYCWFGRGDKPALVKKCMDSWRRILPGWQVIEWNEDNSPISVPYVKNALEVKRYAFAADYVRFHALKTMGGVYLDTDVELIKDISPLLNDKFFTARESLELVNAAIMGSEQNGRFVSLVINELQSRTGSNYESIPKILTDLYNNIQLDQGETVYDMEYFYPYNPFDKSRNEVKQLFFCDITQNTFAIHHWQQSWHYTFIERVINRIRMLLK